MRNQSTPGPWHAAPYPSPFDQQTMRVYTRGRLGTTGIAQVLERRSIDCKGPSREERDNALLLAAAPALAEALRELLRVDVASEAGRYCPDRAERQQQARNALRDAGWDIAL